MRILFISENYYPMYGGAEIVFQNLAEGLIKQGHKVSLITLKLKGTRTSEYINGVQVYRIPAFSRYLFTFLAIPKAITLGRKSDIIQTRTFNAAFPAWIAARITKKPVVLTVHEVWVNKWKHVTAFPKWKAFIHDLLERSIYWLSYDKYICVSDSTRSDLSRIKIPEKKIDVVYNGLDYHLWDKKQYTKKRVVEIRKSLRRSPDDVLFFSWGRPGEAKGFEYLIKAISKVRSTRASFVLMLSGKDEYKAKYQQLIKLIKQENIKGKLILMNPVPYSELGYYISAADCIIIPSIAEGFGYTTVETTALEKPIIVSSAGSLPEVVSGKHLIFNSRDAADLARKIDLAIEQKFRYKQKKIFPWTTTIKQYLQVYQQLSPRKIKLNEIKKQ